jgi:hypothetical protein
MPPEAQNPKIDEVGTMNGEAAQIAEILQQTYDFLP